MTPEPIERPKLARWMWDRKLRPHHVATPFGVSAEQVRKYCLEFGHGDRALPSRDVLQRIEAYTQGEVTERDFYPPHIRGEGPAPVPTPLSAAGSAG